LKTGMIDNVCADKEMFGVSDFIMDEVGDGVVGDVYHVVICI
jgi:hypothetical protein